MAAASKAATGKEEGEESGTNEIKSLME